MMRNREGHLRSDKCREKKLKRESGAGSVWQDGGAGFLRYEDVTLPGDMLENDQLCSGKH